MKGSGDMAQYIFRFKSGEETLESVLEGEYSFSIRQQGKGSESFVIMGYYKDYDAVESGGLKVLYNDFEEDMTDLEISLVEAAKEVVVFRRPIVGVTYFETENLENNEKGFGMTEGDSLKASIRIE
ncbi:hypothetical protein M2140_000126 [Clostridiales Family XIII bacterium PM5-7]